MILEYDIYYPGEIFDRSLLSIQEIKVFNCHIIVTNLSDISGLISAMPASGIYFYTLKADGEFVESRRMILIK